MAQSMLYGLLFMLLAKGTKDPVVTEEVLKEYDFVIVGAGNSGAVVANRLTEIDNVTVLLLEAGPSDLGHPSISIPHLTTSTWGSEFDWKYEIVKQKHALLQLGGTATWMRGKVLGGSTSINAMVYARGSPHDYDSWEDHGADGWGWKDVEPYFKKLEHADENMSKNLGRGGPVKISTRYLSPLGRTIIEAGKVMGLPEVDYHDDRMEGIGTIAHTINEGARESSTTAYLRTVLPERKDRFHVVANAHVTKVLFHEDAEKKSKKKRAFAVHYVRSGISTTVRARKEIILSAGSIETPHILMLSGIGPRKHLKEMGVDVVVDSPGVGSNLQEHNFIWMNYRARNIEKDDVISQDMINRRAMEFILNGTGPLTSSTGNGVVIYAKSKYAGTNVSLSSKKRPFPDVRVIFDNRVNGIHYPTATDEDNGVANAAAAICLGHPQSKGTIRLQSKDPFQKPAIDPKHFSNDDDVKVMIEGFRILDNLESSKMLKDVGYELVVPSYCNGSSNEKAPRSDEFYRCLLTARAKGESHPCCTAKMGQKSNKMAVVDPRLRVLGVDGLRVVDASVMPHETSANLQAPCYMIGEKAADMIKKDWNLKD